MNEAAITLETADISVVLKLLPHRYPFLMVDRVIVPGHFAQEVWIMEADAIRKGPVAKVLMPFVTCEQVHGAWVPRALLDQARGSEAA